MIKLLYLNHDIAFPSPILAKADDGAVHGGRAWTEKRSANCWTGASRLLEPYEGYLADKIGACLDLPGSVTRRAMTGISIKSCFLELLLRGSSTPWKIPQNPFIFCLRTLLFVVVLTEEWHHEAEMENGNFKSEGAVYTVQLIDKSGVSSTSSLIIRAGWSSGTKSSTERGKRNTWSKCQSRKVLPVIPNIDQ